MDKRKAIQIMTKSALLYNQNLNEQKILFLYGSPLEVKSRLHDDCHILPIKGYEVTFHRHNFLHLTGVQTNRFNVSSAIYFYEKCLNNRLVENDFQFATNGSTVQKLNILEYMMNLKHNTTMIGDFTGHGAKLFSEKAVGNVCGCIGFVNDRNTGLNVPNTLLQKDIRDVVAAPVQKVYAVLSKGYTDEKYSQLEKKDIDIQNDLFPEEIERLITQKIF
ncbi:MAG: PBECR4 domain-containing protein [Eubacterium sp.]|nr:PBECR4 domain-containing protein [Eubacterium sp.]